VVCRPLQLLGQGTESEKKIVFPPFPLDWEPRVLPVHTAAGLLHGRVSCESRPLFDLQRFGFFFPCASLTGGVVNDLGAWFR